MAKKKIASVSDFQQLARGLIQVQDEARRLGLHKTARAMDAAIKSSGWEYAEQSKVKP